MKSTKIFLILALAFGLNSFGGPQLLILKNQFGEQSNNFVQGTYLPLPGTSTNLVMFSGSTAPTSGGSGTGHGIAAKGSLYIAQDTGVQYVNTGSTSSPSWSVANAVGVNNGTFIPQTETVSAAGAISTTVMESILANASGSTYAATLAAPSNQDGQIKILKMSTATHTVTVAMTNISMSGGYTPTGTTTLTFSATDQSAVFMAVGSKWVYLGGSAVAS